MDIINYIVYWEKPEILGSGSSKFGILYLSTLTEAFENIRITGRDSLSRIIKQINKDGTVSIIEQKFNFESRNWE